MDDKIKAYRHADTMGKSQIELVLMVYDGALKACRQAAKDYSDGNNEAGFEQIQKIKKFVTHLYTTLDAQQGGEVAENLSKMYVYALTQCYVIEATHDTEALGVLTRVLQNLRSGWAGLRDEIRSAAQSSEEEVETESEEISRELNEEFITTA